MSELPPTPDNQPPWANHPSQYTPPDPVVVDVTPEAPVPLPKNHSKAIVLTIMLALCIAAGVGIAYRGNDPALNVKVKPAASAAASTTQPQPNNKPIKLRGYLTVSGGDGHVSGTWDDCEGTGGYADLDPGMFVTISDAAGIKVGGSSLTSVSPVDFHWLATTRFFASERIANPNEVEALLEELEGFTCMMVFEVDVAKSDFYTLSTGKRGESTYSYEELAADDFVIGLEIGL